MFKKINKVLALSPHTDDIEIGCGGLLNILKKNNVEIHVVNFSFSKNNDILAENIKEEFKRSMTMLEAKLVKTLDLPVRNLSSYRQFILDELLSLKKNNYDLVLCHSSFDCHQDHITVREEAFRAFKDITILGYEMPWNCKSFNSDLFVKLSREDVEFKIKILEEYKSQSHRPYMVKDFIESLAKTRGLQVNMDYAECFEIIRQVWK